MYVHKTYSSAGWKSLMEGSDRFAARDIHIMEVIVTIVSKLLYFTYLPDVFNLLK